MSKKLFGKDVSLFAVIMAVFISGMSKDILFSYVDFDYSVAKNGFNFLNITIDIGVHILFFYIAIKFFGWLYSESESTNNK